MFDLVSNIKTIEILFSAFLFLLPLVSCQDKTTIRNFEELPAVAKKTIINGDTVITANFDLIKDTVDFPVSKLVSELQIIHLENSDSTLVSRYHTFASENYIGVYTMENEYKLFDRQGNFFRQIGQQGQGPGEYQYLYDSYIDEANHRIYLMPWMQKKLFMYNFDGQFLQDIPVPEFFPKTRFKIDTEKQLVTFLILPFKGQNKFAALYQDFKGNILHSINSERFALEPDYGNEVISFRNTQKTDFYIAGWPPKQDTLYYYLPEENRLQPVFTFTASEPFLHYYVELPHHVLTVIAQQEIMDENGQFYLPEPKQFIVDKKSLKGAHVKFVIDEFGNLPVPSRAWFQDGYFILNIYPHELIGGLENILSDTKKKLLDETRSKLVQLQNQIDENGNNIIIIGKLRCNLEQN